MGRGHAFIVVRYDCRLQRRCDVGTAFGFFKSRLPAAQQSVVHTVANTPTLLVFIFCFLFIVNLFGVVYTRCMSGL